MVYRIVFGEVAFRPIVGSALGGLNTEVVGGIYRGKNSRDSNFVDYSHACSKSNGSPNGIVFEPREIFRLQTVYGPCLGWFHSHHRSRYMKDGIRVVRDGPSLPSDDDLDLHRDSFSSFFGLVIALNPRRRVLSLENKGRVVRGYVNCERRHYAYEIGAFYLDGFVKAGRLRRAEICVPKGVMEEIAKSPDFLKKE